MTLLAIAIIFVGCVLWYWLRKITRALAVTGAVQAAAADRAATARGEPPVTGDINVDSVMP